MKKSVAKLLGLILFFGIVTSCLEEDDSYDQQVAGDIEIIEQYLTENSLTAEKFNNTIFKIELTSSSGEEIDTSDVVEAIINLETLDSEESFFLDSSYVYKINNGFFLPFVRGLIPGPNFAIASMKEGEKSQFLFTSNQVFWSTSGEINGVMISPYEIITALIEIKDVRTKEEQAALEAEIIAEYALEEEYITEEEINSDGFYQIITEAGDGVDVIGNAATANIDYKGYLLDGTVFDENTGVVLNTSAVISGFKEGLKGLKKGSKAIIIMPSQMAYGDEGVFGSNGLMSIPPYTPLVFEVTINDFNNI